MGGGPTLPKPKPIRLPVNDPAPLNDRRARTTAQIQKRQGQMSTILSDALKSITGSAGFLGR
jgi:hypothetical protein